MSNLVEVPAGAVRDITLEVVAWALDLAAERVWGSGVELALARVDNVRGQRWWLLMGGEVIGEDGQRLLAVEALMQEAA